MGLALARVEHRQPRPREGKRGKIPDLLPEGGLRLGRAPQARQDISAQVAQGEKRGRFLFFRRGPGGLKLRERPGEVTSRLLDAGVVSRVGEIMRVELPNGLLLVNEVLTNL